MKQMWAWYDIKRDKYCHIYPRRMLVEMCSPDGFKSAEKRGEGKVVKVTVSHLTSRRSRAANACALWDSCDLKLSPGGCLPNCAKRTPPA